MVSVICRRYAISELRMHPASVSDSCASSQINLCFLACALKLGMQYRAVLPEGATQHGAMRVDVGHVMQEIRKLLNQLDQPNLITVTKGNESDALPSHKAV